MRIVVTAGNTLVPIDRVRCLTNIFTGRTGARIALHGHERGHDVTLVTSHPEVVAELSQSTLLPAGRWHVQPYRTFEELEEGLKAALHTSDSDVLIHCAAVSDYQVDGIYAPACGTRFQPDTGYWEAGGGAALVDRSADKVKSSEPELWLRLVRTPKLIDRVRSAWGFRGILVKFKLEAGMSDERLLAVAEESRRQSSADLMVANTLEGRDAWAHLGPLDGAYRRIDREKLPGRLIDAVEQLQRERI